jgi:hypothetical protein
MSGESKAPLPPKMPNCPEFHDDEFKKSSLTWPPHNQTCVAVAQKSGVVAVRNSNDSTKNTVYFTNAEWDAFIGGAKKGEFDYNT